MLVSRRNPCGCLMVWQLCKPVGSLATHPLIFVDFYSNMSSWKFHYKWRFIAAKIRSCGVRKRNMLRIPQSSPVFFSVFHKPFPKGWFVASFPSHIIKDGFSIGRPARPLQVSFDAGTIKCLGIGSRENG